MATDAWSVHLEFGTDKDPDARFKVYSFRGFEAISEPYRFEVEVASTEKNIDFEEMFGKNAWIGIRHGAAGPRRTFRGYVASFEQLDFMEPWVYYRAVLVPHLWLASLSVRSRVFMGKSVPDIVKAILEDKSYPEILFDFQLSEDYPEREYVVQYEESDLDFLRRLLENDGISFHFDHSGSKDKVVFTDGNDAFPRISGEIPWEKVVSAKGEMREAVRRMTSRRRALPKTVVLRDYEWRQDQWIESSAGVDPEKGQGTRYLEGAHYHYMGAKKEDAEKMGSRYAAIRAEELKCRKTAYSGVGNVAAFGAGRVFSLSGYYRNDFDGEHLLTEVRHRATADPGTFSAGGPSRAEYENEFDTLRPKDRFRPRCATAKPRIHGVVSARVDGAEPKLGEYSEIDKLGQYAVRFAYDEAYKEDLKGKGSRRVRKAEPYGGWSNKEVPRMGFHFPLHPGTEVTIGHTNGDPDRPIILGAVPNSAADSATLATHHTVSRIHTGSNNEIEIEDLKQHERIRLWSPNRNTLAYFGHLWPGDLEHKKERSDTTLSKDEPKRHPGICLNTDGAAWLGAQSGAYLAAGDEWEDFWKIETLQKGAESGQKTAGQVESKALDKVLGPNKKVTVADAAKKAAEHATKYAGFQNAAESPFSAWAKGGINFFTPDAMNVIATKGVEIVGEQGAALLGGAGKIQIATETGIGIATESGGVDVSTVKDNINVSTREGYALVRTGQRDDTRAKLEALDVVLDADHHIKIEADDDLLVKARQGKGEVLIYKDLFVESVNAKKITLKAGKSTIEMDDTQIKLWADNIHFEARKLLTVKTPLMKTTETPHIQRLYSEEV